jgi:hypothetical protein
VPLVLCPNRGSAAYRPTCIERRPDGDSTTRGARVSFAKPSDSQSDLLLQAHCFINTSQPCSRIPLLHRATLCQRGRRRREPACIDNPRRGLLRSNQAFLHWTCEANRSKRRRVSRGCGKFWSPMHVLAGGGLVPAGLGRHQPSAQVSPPRFDRSPRTSVARAAGMLPA